MEQEIITQAEIFDMLEHISTFQNIEDYGITLDDIKMTKQQLLTLKNKMLEERADMNNGLSYFHTNMMIVKYYAKLLQIKEDFQQPTEEEVNTFIKMLNHPNRNGELIEPTEEEIEQFIKIYKSALLGTRQTSKEINILSASYKLVEREMLYERKEARFEKKRKRFYRLASDCFLVTCSLGGIVHFHNQEYLNVIGDAGILAMWLQALKRLSKSKRDYEDWEALSLNMDWNVLFAFLANLQNNMPGLSSYVNIIIYFVLARAYGGLAKSDEKQLRK